MRWKVVGLACKAVWLNRRTQRKHVTFKETRRARQRGAERRFVQ